MTMIPDKLQHVTARIEAAQRARGIASGDVRLLAVTKTWGPDEIREAFNAGQRRFGENYVQEAVEKITLLRDLPIEWHLIGPLQSNKTRVVAELFDWVQSVDRLKIAQRLSEQRPAELSRLCICIQVNVDGGGNKSGVEPAQVLALAREVAQLPRLTLRGLMSIPEPAETYEAQLEGHRRMHELFDATGAALVAEGLVDASQWDTLSLGMTGDLEAAVAAGSTMVRVGSAIFGARPSAGVTSSEAGPAV